MHIIPLFINTFLLLYLAAASYIDIRKNSLHIIYIGAGFAAGAALQIITQNLTWPDALLGMIPGAVLLLISLLSRQSVGTADGLIMSVCGIFLGLFRIIWLMLISLTLAGVFSLVLVVIKKAGRNTAVPFIPFVFSGFILLLFFS